jgi:hypothetical protein
MLVQLLFQQWKAGMISRLSSCVYALVGVEDGRVIVASSERYVCHLFSLASSG